MSTEYDLEASTILPRLRTATSSEDVRQMVGAEFARWFGDDLATDSYRGAAAEEIWELWQQSPLRAPERPAAGLCVRRMIRPAKPLPNPESAWIGLFGGDLISGMSQIEAGVYKPGRRPVSGGRIMHVMNNEELGRGSRVTDV